MPLDLKHVHDRINKLRRRAAHEIIIAGSSQPYVLDESLIRAAAAKEFTEGDHRSEDDDACKLILYYIVEGRLPAVDATSFEENDAYQKLLIKAWCLCDKYSMSKLQNLVMGKLLELADECLTDSETVKVAFEQSAPGS